MIKKIIPSTLIGRSIIIIFVPIIIIVLLTSFVFYQTSWSIISKRLTESVAADINVLVNIDCLYYAANENNILDKIKNNNKYVFIKGNTGNNDLVKYILTQYKITHIINFAAHSRQLQFQFSETCSFLVALYFKYHHNMIM